VIEDKDMKRSVQRFFRLLRWQLAEETAFWIFLSVVGGMMYYIIAESIARHIYPPDTPLYTIKWFVCPTFVIWGFSGLAIVIKREVPYTFFLKGKLAIAVGAFISIVWWGLAIACLVK
jgi:hypothetical protein